MPKNKFMQEFTLKNFGLGHPYPSYFTISQWKWPPVVYLVYRIVAALYFLVWLLLSGVLGSNGSRWFLYLTNWTFLLLTLNTVVMATTSVHAYVTSRRVVRDAENTSEELKIAWYLKGQWVIYNTTTAASLLVTVAYWGLLWTPIVGIGMISFNTHAVNSIYVMADLFITATPVRLLHLTHIFVYGLVYLVFTMVYIVAGGTDSYGNNYIYSILDFAGNTRTAVIITCLVLFVGLPLIWLLVYGLAALRVFLAERCCPCGRGYNGDRGEGSGTDIRTASHGKPQPETRSNRDKDEESGTETQPATPGTT